MRIKKVKIKYSQLQSKTYCFYFKYKKSVLFPVISDISLFGLLFCSFVLIKNSVVLIFQISKKLKIAKK